MMKRSERLIRPITAALICALICALLFAFLILPGIRAGKPAQTSETAIDDKYRTTYEIFVGSFVSA